MVYPHTVLYIHVNGKKVAPNKQGHTKKEPGVKMQRELKHKLGNAEDLNVRTIYMCFGAKDIHTYMHIYI